MNVLEKNELKQHCLSLFNKLSEPLTCGAIGLDGVRYQVSNGERSKERIFVLSNELFKHKPEVIYRSFYNDRMSWISAINRYLHYERAFKQPVLKMYCIEKDIITVRNLNFNLDIL